MLVVVLVLAVMTVWVVVAAALALLTGGAIEQRDSHERPVSRRPRMAARHSGGY